MYDRLYSSVLSQSKQAKPGFTNYQLQGLTKKYGNKMRINQINAKFKKSKGKYPKNCKYLRIMTLSRNEPDKTFCV